MTVDSETKKAAYRWVADAITNSLRFNALLPFPSELVRGEAERVRDAMAQAGALPVAVDNDQPVASVLETEIE